MGPDFERRLKAALDKVVPPSPLLSSARYRAGIARRLGRAWRFAPGLVAIGAAGMALTAAAATGSPNPAVWRDRAGTVIQNVGHFPGTSPKAVQSPRSTPRATSQGQGTGTSHSTPSSGHEVEPKVSPEPTDRHGESPRPTPTPSERPEPTPSERPEPSPSPDDHSGKNEPSPSPTPSDHSGNSGN